VGDVLDGTGLEPADAEAKCVLYLLAYPGAESQISYCIVLYLMDSEKVEISTHKR
jgi:hypothetical protein